MSIENLPILQNIPNQGDEFSVAELARYTLKSVDSKLDEMIVGPWEHYVVGKIKESEGESLVVIAGELYKLENEWVFFYGISIQSIEEITTYVTLQVFKPNELVVRSARDDEIESW